MDHLRRFYKKHFLLAVIGFLCLVTAGSSIADTAGDSVPSAGLSEEISSFESYAQRKSIHIKQFGYDLFRTGPGSFAPVEALPVGSDYLLGPGDELKVTLWGKLNSEFSLRIDRDGKAVIPQAGVVYLNGLTFAQAQEYLAREFSKYYLASEVKMNVSMGALRSMRIFVVGKAVRPGSYTLSSLSTVINALFAAGGPSKIGSMRDIQVKRNGKTVARLDLYEFLLKGEKTNDIRLMPEDVIFIPTVARLVGISGNVKVPGIYEFNGETNLKELIEAAGGLDELAIKGRVQLIRISENKREVVSESSLDDIDPSSTMIQAGDLVTIFPIIDDRKVVRLSGAVERSGEYGIGQGLNLQELIALSGGLKYYAYVDEAELTRVTPAQDGPRTEKIKVDLKKALAGDPAHNIALVGNDYLFIRAIPEWALYRTVKISGEVRFPGEYTIKKGETISSLISRAGGFTEEAYLKGAVFTRDSVRELQQQQLDMSISRLEQELLSQSSQSMETALSPESAKLEQAAAAQKMQLVAKFKSVKAKGRISVKITRGDKFKDSPSDLVLDEGDTLFIPETPAQVQVMGSVYNQTSFVYRKDMDVLDYLKSAGGVTANADNEDIYILKVDGTAVSKKAFSWSLGWDDESGRWTGGGFMSAALDPGDTVVVPEKIDKKAWVRDTKDFTQILYQIAVTAGVLIVAF